MIFPAKDTQKREDSLIWVKAIIFHQPELLGHLGMIPLINHDSRARETSEVVMKFTQIDG